MNWPLFLVVCWFFAALQAGLAPLLSVGGRLQGVAQLPMLLAAFVILCIPRTWVALLAACTVGVLMDLQSDPVPGVPLIGPMALGCMTACAVMQAFKRKNLAPSVLSLVFTTFMVGVVAQGVAVVLLRFRGVSLPVWGADPVEGFSLTGECFRRFMEVVSTTALALPLGFLMMWSLPLWGMNSRQVERRFGQGESSH